MKHETDYWKKRQEQLFLQGEKSIKEYYKELKKAFTIAQNEIKLQLFEFYSQYAEENGVSFVEAQKRLSQTELKGLQEYIERVQQTMGTYDLTLSNMSIKARVTRLEALQMQIDAILQELYATSYEQKGKEVLTNIYEDNYNQLWYHSDKYLGIHQEFAYINLRDVEHVISYPFNGQNFSQRLWKQKDFLQMKLNECLTHSLILGTEPSKLAKEFATHFERREYEAYRLLHTETSYVLEQSTLAGYKESGVEYYKILATLDQKTSDICKKQDGKVYAVSVAVVGVNYPPFHIFCRTTTVPEYEDVPAEGFRMARGEDGKPMKVPADMTYLEWEKKYLKGNNLKLPKLNGRINNKPRDDRPILTKEEVIRQAKRYAEILEKNDTMLQHHNRQPIRNYINQQLGYDALPKVVSESEFKRLSEKNKVLYRGVTDGDDMVAEEMCKQFKYGEFYCGKGVYGNGTYVSPYKQVADEYTIKKGNTNKGMIMEMLLEEGTRTISFFDIMVEFEKVRVPMKGDKTTNMYQKVISDVGTYAAIKGYDAILLDGFHNHEHVIILNRGKVIVKE